MDMLYSRYSSPMEFMRLYIDQGRFGEFVSEIIGMENKRKKEKAEEENEKKLWDIYLRSGSDKSYTDWRKDVVAKQKAMNTMSEAPSKDKVVGIIQNSAKILDDFAVEE